MSTHARLHTRCGRLWIDRSTLQPLSAPCAGRLLMTALIEWLVIATAIYTATHLVDAWYFKGLAILVVGSRQHALLVLMHEFSHKQWSRIHPKLNDALGNLLTAWPLLISVQGFRRNHLLHHLHVQTDQDPSWMEVRHQATHQFPKSRAQLWWTVLAYLSGLHSLRRIKNDVLKTSSSDRTADGFNVWQTLFVSVILLLVGWTQDWWVVALYWVLPSLTIMQALLYVVEISEHAALPGDGGWEFSRSLRLNAVARWLLAPYGVSFHAEHHLAPAVPVFKLQAFHTQMMQNPLYVQKAIVTTGYLNLFAELSKGIHADSNVTGMYTDSKL